MASMRELFPEFYFESLTVNDLEREQNNLIVFDSNFLLDILRLPTEIAEKYLEAIEKVKEHIFVPYLVGVEFHFNKKKVKIETQEYLNLYRDRVTSVVNEKVKDLHEQMLSSLMDEENVNFLKNRNQKDSALNEIQKSVDSYNKLLLSEKDKLIERLHNDIFERYTTDLNVLSNKIAELVGQSVGSKLEQRLIDEIQKKGENRYANDIPPGFNDREEKEGKTRRYSNLIYDTQYGDYIIWEEILHKVAKNGKNIGRKVIFVTSDGTSKKKNDIMYSVKGKKVGPYIHMVNELYELKENYSLLESGETGDKLNKELYVIDGFRFMQLANDLNDAEAKQYEVDPFINKKTSSKNEILNLEKDINISEFQNRRRRIRSLSKEEKILKERLMLLTNRLEVVTTEEEKEELLSQIRNLEIRLTRLMLKKYKLRKLSNSEILEEDALEESGPSRATEIEDLLLERERCRRNIRHVSMLIDNEIEQENIEQLHRMLDNLKLAEQELSQRIMRYKDNFYGDIE